jgi:hypothetical protein
MIGWFMRRRCFWCARSAIGMCWSHHMVVHHLLNRAGRIALVSIGTAFLVSLVLAGVAGWYGKVSWELSHLVGR